MSLSEKHMIVMESVKEGATIYGYREAKVLREVQKENPEYIDIIDDLNELSNITHTIFDGKEELPYFGAILTDKGKAFLLKSELKSKEEN